VNLSSESCANGREGFHGNLNQRNSLSTMEHGKAEIGGGDPASHHTMCADEPGAKPKQFWERKKTMKRVLSATATVVTIVTAVAWATSSAERSQEIVGLTADEVRWFTPPYYNDGRQRAHLFGESSQGGTWIDRVKIPGGARVLAHTHPQTN
jgi:hypothetical protein